jgi:hypothetical protein
MVRQLSALLAGEVSGAEAFQRHAGLSGVGHPAAEPLAHGDRQVPPRAMNWQAMVRRTCRQGIGTDVGRRTPWGRERVS